MSIETTKTIHPQKRTRSPGYPTTNLKDALEKAKIVWTNDGRNEASIGALAVQWGYNPKSSSALQFAAALKKFGLFNDVEGKNAHAKLSDLAIRIFADEDPESAEKAKHLKRAALSPKIYSNLWQKYSGTLPSDATMKAFLIADLKFNPDAVDKFIKDFRDTILFAKLSPDDKVLVANEQDNSESSEYQNDISKSLFQKKHVVESLKVVMPTVTLPVNLPNPPTPLVLREFNFPLPSGMAALQVPFPLTEADFESLTKTLMNFKEGLVKTEIPSVDCKVPDCEAQAEALAAAGIEFNLVNFSYSHDIGFATKIANEHGFKLRLNLNWGMAILKKKSRSLPASATWKAKDSDRPVTIVREMGSHCGVRYFQSEDGTGIPETEIVFDCRD